MSDDISRRQAIRAAKRKLPLLPVSQLRRNLHVAGLSEDAAEAYRIGAEEAQREIVARLQSLESPIPRIGDD